MKRDYQAEFENRVAWIRELLQQAGIQRIVYGNSGGKDCTLAAILCKAACPDTLGVIMPCGSARNYGRDRDDALLAARQYDIETIEVDLTATRDTLLSAVTTGQGEAPEGLAFANLNPRLRMTTLYCIAQSRGALVCGTGNRSEYQMGYFTKWGDGGYDFNPIFDLTASEVFEFLRFLGAPTEIIEKAPSAALFDDQTDEKEMGVTYAAIDRYLEDGTGTPEDLAVIRRLQGRSAHKRLPAKVYQGS